MAKRKVMSKIMSYFSGNIPLVQTDEPTKGLRVPRSSSVINEKTRDAMLKQELVQPRERSRGSIQDYIRAVVRDTAVKRADADHAMKMSPEVKQTADVMVSSIMSPNDLAPGKVQITSEHLEITDPEIHQKIAKELTNHFEETIKLSRKMPDWIEEALYRSGAKPILVLPSSKIEEIVMGDDRKSASTESLKDGLARVSRESFFGMADVPGEGLSVSIEDLSASFETLLDPMRTQKEGTYDAEGMAQKQAAVTKDFAELVLSQEALSVADNPFLISYGYAMNAAGKKKLTDGMSRIRREFIALSPVDNLEELTGQPILMELPPECVLPIYAPGNPEDHVGYYVVLDEGGHPLDVLARPNMTGMLLTKDNGNFNSFSSLLNTYGMTTPADYNSPKQQELMGDIYKSVVEAHLKAKLTRVGFKDIDVGSNPSIYRCMFARFLHRQHTRVLFIPKDFITYFCWRYDANGTGKSKIHDIEFVLSLRTSLLVARALTAVTNAIDRRKLTMKFSEDYAGNPLEDMNLLVQEAIKKSTFSWSADPASTSQQIASKALTIVTQGIPGMENFELTNEANDRSGGTIDPDILQETKDLLTLQLDVPPSALNNLAENEYMHTAATVHLMFSRKVVLYQNIFGERATDFVRKWVQYSPTLRAKIRDILKTPEDENKDDGTVSETKGLDKRVDDVINHLWVRLPKPNVVVDRTQFESAKDIVDGVSAMVDALYPDDMAAGDQDLQPGLQGIRALTKSILIRKYLATIGGPVDVDELDNVSPVDLLDIKTALTNMAKALKEHKKTLNPEDDMTGGFTGGSAPTDMSSSNGWQ